MAGAAKIDRVRIVLTDPISRDQVTYRFDNLEEAKAFIEKQLAEQENGA